MFGLPALDKNSFKKTKTKKQKGKKSCLQLHLSLN